jgi:hypothetical protein
MRRVILAAGLFAAALGLSACNSKSDDAAATAPPPPPKDTARSQTMYQGQELIQKVDAGDIKAGKAGTLDMEAKGTVGMAGYAKATFLNRINAYPPKDGIYDVDVVADKPAAGAAVETPIEVKGAWSPYPADHLKGVRFMSKTNSVVVMLPAG